MRVFITAVAAVVISYFVGSAEAANSSIPAHAYPEDDWRYEDDMIFVGENLEFNGTGSRRLQEGSLAGPEQYFELISNFEARRDKRTGSSMWQVLDGKPTLTKMHYIVMPCWWGDQPRDTGVVDVARTQRTLDNVSQQYAAMSWNKHALTFDLWDQVALSGTTVDDPNRAVTVARELIAARGLVQFRDYTGLMLVYNPTGRGSNIFTHGGGSGIINDSFLTSSNPLQVSVLRHEIGHNYGLPHNRRNTYNTRGTGGQVPFDGFEMMSGGNHYAQSDHQAATKWSFGWIPDSAVVLMQPEGSSGLCRSCKSSVTGLLLRPFDDPNVTPSQRNIMAVNIPIFGTPAEASSYWLSYRGISADGDAAGGLTIHQGRFKVGGIFASEYSSVNFDVGGDTETKLDAFVTPGNCYVITPPKRLLDTDFSGAQRVKPIVCVDGVDPGKSITISVSFLNESSPPVTRVSLASRQRELQCSQSGSNTGLYEVDVSGGKAHILHHTGTGDQGKITTNLCMSSGTTSSATAYFYDSYPYAFMAFGSPAGYGAFRSIDVATSCQSFSSLDYESLTGEAYILIVGDSNAASNAKVRLQSRCTVSECLQGDLLSSGTCSSCPVTPNIFTARAWRIVKRSAQAASYIWDVTQLSFYSDLDCSANSQVNVGNLIDSGNAGRGWTPNNALNTNDQSVWGGRPGGDGTFFLRAEFSKLTTVRCIRINERGGAGGFTVESRQSLTQGCWDTVLTTEGTGGTRVITLDSDDGGNRNYCPEEDEYLNANTNTCTRCPALVDDFGLHTASAWRLSAPLAALSNRGIWDVGDFEFYSTHDCKVGTSIRRSQGSAFSSGTAGHGYGAHHAFDGNSKTVWGGRPNAQGVFNLGIDFNAETEQVRCIRVVQSGDNQVSIQNRQNPAIDCWENARSSVVRLREGTNTISLTNCQKPASIFQAREWRVYAPRPWIRGGEVWDISEVAFYSSDNCAENSRLDTSRARAVSSGIAGFGYGAHHAFDRNSGTIWGGRGNREGHFFVGLDFLSPVTVKCVKVTQTGNAINFNVQARQRPTSGNCWENVKTVTNPRQGQSTVRLDTSRRFLRAAPPANNNATSIDVHG